jgi:succinate dehydrogenase/fumarate reductase flavoprotein subunit
VTRNDDQGDLFDGVSRRDSGMTLAADAQDDKDPGWSDRALAAIIALAKQQDELHTDDLAAAFAETPRHFNAWGAVWMRAIRERIIERTGRYHAARDPKKHAHVYPIYRSLMRGRL